MSIVPFTCSTSRLVVDVSFGEMLIPLGDNWLEALEKDLVAV